MSLYGMMRTGVSGMQGQASKLSTVADNIANSATTGYKKLGVEFSTLVVNSLPNSHNSGGIITNVRQHISQQGVMQFTNSGLDLAIDGGGFFVVKDDNGSSFMTRAGSFVPDEEGRLVNSAGYYLAGYSYANGDPAVTANSLDGTEIVRLDNTEMTATPSQFGNFRVNFPADEPASAAPLPSTNVAAAEFTHKSSVLAYDNLGGSQLLDVYMTKTAANTWEVAVFDQAQAAPGTNFPYGAGPLATQTVTFDGTTGQPNGATTIAVPVPDGQTLTFDMAGSTQLSADFTAYDISVDGNAPSSVEELNISADGTVYAQYENETLRPLFRVPLATVMSPDRLTSLSGNIFVANEDSGDVRLGFPGEDDLGGIVSGALESSNVDIAEELTKMIEGQRNYTANSKVFQTGSELMDVLLTLKR
ncbi:MAG: flagellar hook protein FlgE [Roseitalea porphyridii]|jgi:flagellar hook protein FlgE|uniref:flagellar hook protein FlgE n=1 Tax=Roseitalea porphyridii TaxID=1852022 RepID=UPI0032D94B4C